MEFITHNKISCSRTPPGAEIIQCLFGTRHCACRGIFRRARTSLPQTTRRRGLGSRTFSVEAPLDRTGGWCFQESDLVTCALLIAPATLIYEGRNPLAEQRHQPAAVTRPHGGAFREIGDAAKRRSGGPIIEPYTSHRLTFWAC